MQTKGRRRPMTGQQRDLSLRMDVICLDPSAFASTSPLMALEALASDSNRGPARILGVDDGFYDALKSATLPVDHPESKPEILGRILSQWGERAPAAENKEKTR
jgi:hypothetical protein